MAKDQETVEKQKVSAQSGILDPGDSVTVHLAFKKNLGNYQTMDFGCGVTVTHRDGDDPSETWRRAWDQTETELDNAVAEAVKVLEG